MAVITAGAAPTGTTSLGGNLPRVWDDVSAPLDATDVVLRAPDGPTVTRSSSTDTDLLQAGRAHIGPQITGAPRITGAQCYATDPAYAVLTTWFLEAAVYAAVKAVPQPLSTSEALERLRAWTGLTTTGIAELLGVARRSLYHWTSAGVRPRQEGRLLNLVEAIEPYAGRVESWQLRDALVSSDAREAVADGDREAIRLVVEQTIERRPHRLRRAGGEASAEPAPIGMAELREYLHGVSAPVRRDRAATYVPRELSDSDYPPDA